MVHKKKESARELQFFIIVLKSDDQDTAKFFRVWGETIARDIYLRVYDVETQKEIFQVLDGFFFFFFKFA